MIRRGNAEDPLVSRRREECIRAAVPRRGDDQGPLLRCVVDDILLKLRSSLAAPAAVDDLRSHVRRVHNPLIAGDDVSLPAGANVVIGRTFDWENPALERDGGHADTVIRYRRCDPCNVRPVVVVICRRCGIVIPLRALPSGPDEIPPMHIIRIAVVIVIDAIARCFAGVCPNVRREIRVVPIDTAVDDRNDDRRVAGRDIPGGGRIYLLQIPLIQIERVIWGERSMSDRVDKPRFCILHIRELRKLFGHRKWIVGRREGDNVDERQVDLAGFRGGGLKRKHLLRRSHRCVRENSVDRRDSEGTL